MGHNKDRRPDYPKEGKKHFLRKRKIKPVYIFLIAIVVLLGARAAYTEYTIWKIETDPIETNAKVYGRSISNGHGYFRRYKFDVDGVTYYGNAAYGCEVGDVIKIRYYSKDPSKNYSVYNGKCVSK